MFVASDWNATIRPFAEISGENESLLPWTLSELALTSTVVLRRRSRRNTSVCWLPSARTRFVASESNTT